MPLNAMARDAPSLLELVLVLTMTSQKRTHPITWKVLSSQEIVEGLLSSASLVFAPGLLEVLKASTPPTLSFFKTLPANSRSTKQWAVYLIVLEKEGC
jgi:hypothetical protein